MERQRLIFAVVGAYLLAVGVLTGMLVDRIRFDEARSVLLMNLEEDTHRLHEEILATEREETAQRKSTP